MKPRTAWILFITFVAAAMLGVYLNHRPKPMKGSKAITIEVLGKDEEKPKTYSGKTDAEYLSEAMDDFSAVGFTYEASEGDWGLFVTTVDGVVADSEDSAYWAIYVNGEYGMYGVDQQPVTDGDTFRFAYETY